VLKGTERLTAPVSASQNRTTPSSQTPTTDFPSFENPSLKAIAGEENSRSAATAAVAAVRRTRAKRTSGFLQHIRLSPIRCQTALPRERLRVSHRALPVGSVPDCRGAALSASAFADRLQRRDRWRNTSASPSCGGQVLVPGSEHVGKRGPGSAPA